MKKAPVSVLIPTKNEVLNLPSTLDHLAWADQIVIFDSFSTDKTVALAKTRGCDVYQREFDNFSDHKNWALRHIDFRNEWILILDADEKVSSDLAEEIRKICENDPEYTAYYVARQVWVDGVWLKHAGKYPDYNIRLFRKGSAWYERRIVHEHMLVTGRTGFLKNHLVHIDAKGTHRYIERHNRYAEMEAVEAFIAIHSEQDEGNIWLSPTRWKTGARRALKIFAYRHLPFRPLLVFLYLYIFRLGFVMGGAGLKTCTLRMFYEYMIDLYLREIKDPASPIYMQYRNYIEERCGKPIRADMP